MPSKIDHLVFIQSMSLASKIVNIDHVNLLFIVDDKTGKSHYTLIRNMSRLLGDRTSHNGMAYYCDYCLHSFIRQQLLENHAEDCKKFGIQKITLPKEEENSSPSKQSKNSCQCQSSSMQTLSYSPQKFKSVKIRVRRRTLTNCLCRRVIRFTSSAAIPSLNSCWNATMDQLNVVERFLRRLREEYQKIEQLLSHIEPMIITEEQEKEFRTVENCYLCKQPFEADRVRNHCHMTGLYRGAAHGECNLKLKYRGRANSTDEKRRFAATWCR